MVMFTNGEQAFVVTKDARHMLLSLFNSKIYYVYTFGPPKIFKPNPNP